MRNTQTCLILEPEMQERQKLQPCDFFKELDPFFFEAIIEHKIAYRSASAAANNVSGSVDASFQLASLAIVVLFRKYSTIEVLSR